jgi:hypothetical protein
MTQQRSAALCPAYSLRLHPAVQVLMIDEVYRSRAVGALSTMRSAQRDKLRVRLQCECVLSLCVAAAR